MNNILIIRCNDKVPMFKTDDPTPVYVDALINWNRSGEILELIVNWMRRGKNLNGAITFVITLVRPI